jgi:CBS domain-containing protein
MAKDSFLVRDLMSRPVITVEPGRTIRDAAKLMERHSIGCLVVVVAEDRRRALRRPRAERPQGRFRRRRGGEAVGILTERDIVRKFCTTRASPGHFTVAQAMSAPLVTLGPEQTIHDAFRVMQEEGIRRLPVVVDGRVAGILTDRDLLKAHPRVVAGLLELLNESVSALGKALARE